MSILHEPKAWRKERVATSREPDLSPDQIVNVKRAIHFLTRRHGNLAKLAKAMCMPRCTVARASNKRGIVTARTALRLARVAEAPLDDVLNGSWATGTACPRCGRV
jgi:hypothetical protein